MKKLSCAGLLLIGTLVVWAGPALAQQGSKGTPVVRPGPASAQQGPKKTPVVRPGPASAQQGPKKTVEAATARIHALVSKRVAEGSAAAQRRDKQLRQIVSTFLDIDHMAQKALGRRWEKRTPVERSQYLDLMRQLVERSYLRHARNRGDYQVKFGRVALSGQGQEAEVETVLRVTKRGRREEMEIIYSLEQRDGRWRVTDVETDGASTVRNYRAQFRRMEFDQLLARMRRRLAEGEADL